MPELEKIIDARKYRTKARAIAQREKDKGNKPSPTAIARKLNAIYKLPKNGVPARTTKHVWYYLNVDTKE